MAVSTFVCTSQPARGQHKQCGTVARRSPSIRGLALGGGGAPAAAAAASTCGVSRQRGAAASVPHRRAIRAAAAGVEAAAAAGQLPRTPGAMVDQAAAAVQAGMDAGRLRQIVTLLLPVNEKEADFNNTEPIDYPCSLQKEFDTACALAKALLQRLLGAGAAISAKRIDDGGVEGEPCAVLYPEDRSMVAVVFPTADRLKQLQAYAKEEGRPLLIVNAQWRNEGQVISDFGIGPWRKAAEDFLATFEPSYVLKEKRIGSPGSVDIAAGTRFVTGGVVRVLRQFPGPYEAHAMAANGASQLLEAGDAEPGYKDLDAAIKRGRAAKMQIFAIAQQATAMYRSGDEGGDDEGGEGGEGGAAGGGGEDLAGLSDADIEAMDAATLRRLLAARGLPGSGKVSKLRQRLQEARDGK